MNVLLASFAALAGAFPHPVETRTLDNGLTVHVVPMPSPGVVTYATWMDVGSRDEVDPGRTGFAHFFEHLMFYGTVSLGEAERERTILQLGADENAWTWFDETVYHATLPASELPRLVEIEADRFQHLHLTEEMVQRESGAVYGEFRKGRANPDARLAETLYATAFPTHTYGHDTIGHEADIAAMPSAHAYAREFFDRHYRPERATILVVGDVAPAATFALVEDAYGGWERGTLPPPEVPVEPPQQAPRVAEIDWPSPTAARMAFGWRVPAHDPDDPDVAALQVASDLLLSPVGPLVRRLVHSGLAYDVAGGRDDFVDPGLLTVAVTFEDPDQLAEIARIVVEEVQALSEPVAHARLDATKQHARYALLTGLDDPKAVAMTLGWAARRGGGPDAVDRFAANLDAVTPAQVADVARRTFVPSGLTVVTLLPPGARAALPPDGPWSTAEVSP